MAFGNVQSALSWVIDSYSTIANLKAIVYRLNGFNESIEQWNEAQNHVKELVNTQDDTAISVKNLEIMLPDNRILLKCPELNFTKGSYLVTGPSGSGKSTLFRVISGIWPFIKGQINIPANLKAMFLPQVSYMPIGTLHQVLCYPDMNQEIPVKLEALLKYLGLEKLLERLDEVEEWSRVLSQGEQQKIAFVRTILAEPDVVFLDEATSAMDEESEAACYGMLKTHLPNATIISIGHRSTIRKYHDKYLVVKDKLLRIA
jgi:putative ATP-binding cassette transporter